MVTAVMSDEQLASWSARGFFRVPAFARAETCEAMLERVTRIVREPELAGALGAKVLPESNKAGVAVEQPEDAVSKVFKLHRDTVFASFAHSADVVDLVSPLIGSDDVDVFLSQFIFKTPGAWGQPWHQDSFYFPFEPARPVVGVWLAVTEATLANGCLHVLPGSQTEPVHTHVPDRRPGANYGYFEILDHDMIAVRAGADGPGRPAGLRQPSDAPVDGQRIPRDPGRDGVPLRRRRDDRPQRGVLPVPQRLGPRAAWWTGDRNGGGES